MHLINYLVCIDLSSNPSLIQLRKLTLRLLMCEFDKSFDWALVRWHLKFATNITKLISVKSRQFLENTHAIQSPQLLSRVRIISVFPQGNFYWLSVFVYQYLILENMNLFFADLGFGFAYASVSKKQIHILSDQILVYKNR